MKATLEFKESLRSGDLVRRLPSYGGITILTAQVAGVIDARPCGMGLLCVKIHSSCF